MSETTNKPHADTRHAATPEGTRAGHEHHIVPVRTYLLVFSVLMVLLIATIVAAKVDIGGAVGGLIVAFTIATVKAVFVILYFMHVKYSSRLTWVFAGAAFFWLGILFVMTLADYLSRPHVAPWAY